MLEASTVAHFWQRRILFGLVRSIYHQPGDTDMAIRVSQAFMQDYGFEGCEVD